MLDSTSISASFSQKKLKKHHNTVTTNKCARESISAWRGKFLVDKVKKGEDIFDPFVFVKQIVVICLLASKMAASIKRK